MLLQKASPSRYKKLEDLLEKSFSLVKMPSLQPVVMCVMKHLPKVETTGQRAQGSLCPAPALGEVGLALAQGGSFALGRLPELSVCPDEGHKPGRD